MEGGGVQSNGRAPPREVGDEGGGDEGPDGAPVGWNVGIPEGGSNGPFTSESVDSYRGSSVVLELMSRDEAELVNRLGPLDLVPTTRSVAT